MFGKTKKEETTVYSKEATANTETERPSATLSMKGRSFAHMAKTAGLTAETFEELLAAWSELNENEKAHCFDKDIEKSNLELLAERLEKLGMEVYSLNTVFDALSMHHPSETVVYAIHGPSGVSLDISMENELYTLEVLKEGRLVESTQFKDDITESKGRELYIIITDSL